MSTETIATLREHLFTTIRGLTNKSDPMDIERARAVGDIAQTIINSAKVELEAIKLSGNATGSGFIPLEAPPKKPAKTSGAQVIESRPGVTVTRHRCE